MKLFPALSATTVLVAASSLHAAQVELSGSFSVLEPYGFVFTPDGGDGNPGTGLLYGPLAESDPNFNPNYDDALADSELREIFNNPDRQYGGAFFDDTDYKWKVPSQNAAFDEIRTSLTFDADVFEKSNLLGANPDADLSRAPTSSLWEAYSDGNFIGSLALSDTITVAGDNIEIGDTGQIADVIAVSTVRPNDTGPAGSEPFRYDFIVIGESNWFESLEDGQNALETIGDKEQLVSFTEELYGFDGENYSYFGENEIQATLNGPLTISQRGLNEDLALLPDAVNEDGGFQFDVVIEDLTDPGGVIWIDPDIAVGYVYDLGGAEIAGLQAPSFDAVADADGYMITVVVDGVETSFAIDTGEKVLFADKGIQGPVTSFTLTGIDQSLMLDPENPAIFQTGIIAGPNVTGLVQFSQTPLTVFVPDEVATVPVPLPALMLLSGLGGLAAVRRAKRA